MLIEFRVENHRSLRDEQALTMEAGRIGESSDPRPRSVTGHAKSLLPAAVIYGANASGKSNVLAALAFMRAVVAHSHRQGDPEGGIPRTAFAWGDGRNESSMFEASFLVDQTKYVYGFAVDDEVVQEEWLFAWPNKRKQMWFEREGDTFKFGEHLKGPNDVVKEVTRPNALFLSVATQHRHERLRPIYTWFRGICCINIPCRAYRRHSMGGGSPFYMFDDKKTSCVQEDEARNTLAARIRQLLKAADIGIVDVKSTDNEEEHLGLTQWRRRLFLQHQTADDESWLELREESEGTKTLFQMAPKVFRALDSGGLLLVDELEASLHPSLGLVIVKLFNSPKTNPNNAQIVFTTHDTNLLSTTLEEPPLRRDQVWFTEKDKDGASRLYPLTDYKPRKAENLERGYLQGRYGAIPFLGDITWITE
jgi:uncharacterized protein